MELYKMQEEQSHVCFCALTFAGPLRRRFNTQPCSLVFKQLPWDPAILMHEKTCVIPILYTLTEIIALAFKHQ